jgi:carbamoyl-phosphate synthase large subunit
MTEALTVLVLGVGGNVSQGILKALALSSLRLRVVGACISPHAFGLYTADTAYISPRADDPEFLSWLLDVCRRERVQAVFSGVEPVLAFLASHADEIRRETGATCVVSDPAALAVGGDKVATCQWLAQHGFNSPRWARAEDAQAVQVVVNACGYPLIAKPRTGKGRHGVVDVRNPADLAWVMAQADYIIQEHLGDDESEYTAGCFCDRAGRVAGSIVMRRGLLEGTTVWAELGEFPDVRAEAERIGAALRPMGPCNVQLRISKGKAVCFEINVRFSGTTPMRAHLGFNDVDAALRHYVLGEPVPPLPVITEGLVLRYWNEGYAHPRSYQALIQARRLDSPREGTLEVETYGMRR